MRTKTLGLPRLTIRGRLLHGQDFTGLVACARLVQCFVNNYYQSRRMWIQECCRVDNIDTLLQCSHISTAMGFCGKFTQKGCLR